jgi:hypothetical protein
MDRSSPESGARALFQTSGLGWLPLGLLVVMWVVALSQYTRLPDILPTHYLFGGAPETWGPKGPGFFSLPAVATVIFLALGVIAAVSVKRPIVSGVMLHGLAAKKVGQAMGRFVMLMRGGMLAFLLNMQFRAIQVAYGSRETLGWDSYFVAGLLFVYGLVGAILLYRTGRHWLRWQQEKLVAYLQEQAGDGGA